MNAILFPIWKDESRGIIRPIYDCRSLNARLRGQTFVLSDIKQFLMMKEPGDYYAKIDLTNAYWHFEMDKSHRKYLGIRWRGEIYRWTVLPFGLRIVPYAFQKALKGLDKWISEELHVKHLSYLDDLLFIGSKEKLKTKVPWVIGVLKDMGFDIS